jgi:hypothetical protein
MASATWDIANMERHLPDGSTPPSGEVYTIHWTVSLEEQGESAGAYGSIGLGGAEASSYTPFDEITKDQAIGWVKETLGDEKVGEIEAALQQQLDQQHAPTKAAGLPWAG